MTIIKPLEYIDNFLMDLDAILADHGIDKADITIQLGVSEARIKPAGNIAYGRIVDKICKCGCRLKTDGELTWCSSPKCQFIEGK